LTWSQVQILPLRPVNLDFALASPTDTPTDIAGRDMCVLKHNLAKVGVEGSNPFARSNFINSLAMLGDTKLLP